MNTRTALAVATLALLGAGCGSAGPQTSTHQSSGGPGAAAYRYVNCMRSHGIPNVPDPRISTGPGYTKVAVMAPQSAVASPHFKTAQRACSGILPGPGNARSQELGHKQAFLAFARCMRARGMSGFPDPDAQGQITPTMLAVSGIDLRSRGFFREALACAPVTHGVITAAQVQQAVSGSH